MKTLYQSLLVSIGVLAIAGAAYAQVPAGTWTGNDISDTNGNTGMGSSALLSLSGGISNTASGYQALFSNTSGNYNTASGTNALYSNSTGYNNTAYGFQALYTNSTGYYNTAYGSDTLSYNTTGTSNTASGYQALLSNTTGIANSASGAYALSFNTTGTYNTASGIQALKANTTGSFNTASGARALFSNTTASDNTASGYYALQGNTTGAQNTASGSGALYTNYGGAGNTATGFRALYANFNHNYNTALGYQALYRTNANYNIGVGFRAGFNLTTGSNNIDIGNQGVAAESGVIRIGTQVPTPLQTNTYIAGIYNNTSVSGLAVVIDSNGQLGAVVSSERFKTAIKPMGSNTAKLEQLRPVTFKLKSDPQGALRYGLIAEEVALVYPELVIRGEKGRIDGVRYDELAPMLLNEVQQQHRVIAAQAAEIHELTTRQLATQAEQLRMQQQLAELKDLNQAMQVALRKLQTRDELVAQR